MAHIFAPLNLFLSAKTHMKDLQHNAMMCASHLPEHTFWLEKSVFEKVQWTGRQTEIQAGIWCQTQKDELLPCFELSFT